MPNLELTKAFCYLFSWLPNSIWCVNNGN